MRDKQNEITVRAGRTTQPQGLVPPSPRKAHEQQAVCGTACQEPAAARNQSEGTMEVLRTF